MDWDNSKIIIAKNGSSKPTNDKEMDYHKYPQYLYILARSYQTQQDLVSLKEITEIWASLAKILKALQINFS